MSERLSPTLIVEEPDREAVVDFLSWGVVNIKIHDDGTMDIEVRAGEYGEIKGSFTVSDLEREDALGVCEVCGERAYTDEDDHER